MHSQVEISAGFVTDEDCCVACVECVSDSLGKVLIKLIDAGDVACTLSQVEEDFAFVVRRGLVTQLDFWQETSTREDVKNDECANENKRDDHVRSTAICIDISQPAASEDNEVNRNE